MRAKFRMKLCRELDRNKCYGFGFVDLWNCVENLNVVDLDNDALPSLLIVPPPNFDNSILNRPNSIDLIFDIFITGLLIIQDIQSIYKEIVPIWNLYRECYPLSLYYSRQMKVLICILVFLCTLCSCVFFRGLVNSLTVTFHHLASKSQNLPGFSNSFSQQLCLSNTTKWSHSTKWSFQICNKKNNWQYSRQC